MALQYQDFLLEEFRTRRGRDPQYSLRAFARDLGMPASKLSQNLRGLCGISVTKAGGLADRIQMRAEERSLFLTLVESRHARSRVAREQAGLLLSRMREQKLDVLSLEKFAVVRDWYHFAILELTTVRDFEPNAEWIARRLAITVSEATEAVRRLRALGLLSVSDTGWGKASTDLEFAGADSGSTVREHHRQVLTKAGAALDSVSPEGREFGTLTFAVDRARLPEMKTLVQEFQRKINALDQGGPKDAVYALSIQLFPLTVD